MDIQQVTESDGNRYYQVGSKKYKSVTTIIGALQDKTALFSWRERVGEDKAKEITNSAAVRGTKVHKYIEDYLTKNIDSDNIYFQKMKPILNLIQPFAIEEKTYWFNDSYGFAGTIDIGGYINTDNLISRVSGKLPDNISFIGDFKTWNKQKTPIGQTQGGNKYYPLLSYYLQLAAYTAAHNQRNQCKYRLNQCLLFGVTDNCRQPFIYYLNPEAVNFYWSKMKELVHCYYNNHYFDWKQLERESEYYCGERVDLKL